MIKTSAANNLLINGKAKTTYTRNYYLLKLLQLNDN